MILRGDARALPLPDESVDLAVGSPPYNVGIPYDEHNDSMAWREYRMAALAWAGEMERVLKPTGRVFLNVAPVVQEQPGGAGRNGGPHSGRSQKDRTSLLAIWSGALEAKGLKPCDIIAWTSQRGSGTAWGSYQMPSAPNIRGDWEAVLVYYKESWPRTPPAGYEGWRDTLGNWPALVSNVWMIRPEFDRLGHPVPFPVEIPARAIRLSTWPGQVVLDPFCGSGATLLAADQLGRRGVGVEISEGYCQMARARTAQTVLFDPSHYARAEPVAALLDTGPSGTGDTDG